jgi:hypothetical protein
VQINIDDSGNVTPDNTTINNGGSIQFIAKVACSFIVPVNPPPPLKFPSGGGPISVEPNPPIYGAISNNATVNYYININGYVFGPYSITVGDPAPLVLQVVGAANALSQVPQNAAIPNGGSIQYTNAPYDCTAIFSDAGAFGVGSLFIQQATASQYLTAVENDVIVEVTFTTRGKQIRQGKNTIKIGH